MAKKTPKLQLINPICGADGATFTPSVSESGDLTWTNNKGLPNPAPVNIVSTVIEKLPAYNGECETNKIYNRECETSEEKTGG